MKKVLLLPKYPRLGASSRVRTYQYIPFWKSEGYEVDIFPFFNLPYLHSVYNHIRPGVWNVLGCYFSRFSKCLFAWKYDLVIIEKEVFPYLPATAERLFAKVGVKFVVDYDDAVFHNYDLHKSNLIAKVLGPKIDHVMSSAAAVWVGNEYLASRARTAGSRQIMFLPTSVDINRYQTKQHQNIDIPVVGWVGSPTTIKYLRAMLPVLEQLRGLVAFKLLVIGKDCSLDYSGEIEIENWQEETEAEQLLKLDIGIMPLPNSAWEQGKCSYKLIQYMACGLPVVASPIGMNKEVVTPGLNGFLAESDQDWINHLFTLIMDADLRQSLGTQGRKLVENHYTTEKNWQKIMAFIEGKQKPKEIVNP